jgi:hypothetical protein
VIFLPVEAKNFGVVGAELFSRFNFEILMRESCKYDLWQVMGELKLIDGFQFT